MKNKQEELQEKADFIRDSMREDGIVMKSKTKEEIQVNCPYCGEPAEWVENKEIYGKNYGKSYMAWLCRKDDAYVGCHQNTKKPLGKMANKELREWRKKAHRVFDPLWKTGKMSRKKAYRLLYEKTGKWIHMGDSNVEDCKLVLSVLT
jgi:hypothetical protein